MKRCCYGELRPRVQCRRCMSSTYIHTNRDARMGKVGRYPWYVRMYVCTYLRHRKKKRRETGLNGWMQMMVMVMVMKKKKRRRTKTERFFFSAEEQEETPLNLISPMVVHPNSIFLGSSMYSLTFTRKVTASLPSKRR